VLHSAVATPFAAFHAPAPIQFVFHAKKRGIEAMTILQQVCPRFCFSGCKTQKTRYAKECHPLPGRTQTGPWATEILPSSFYSSCRVRLQVNSERSAARNDVLHSVVPAPFAAQSGVTATFHAPAPIQFVFHAKMHGNQHDY